MNSIVGYNLIGMIMKKELELRWSKSSVYVNTTY